MGELIDCFPLKCYEPAQTQHTQCARREEQNVRSDCQPTAHYNHYRQLTVADVLLALKDMPANARIRCQSGGYLEANASSAWAEPKVTEDKIPTILTTWI